MLNPEDAALVIVDVQGKLASLMHERESLYKNLVAMVKGARALKLPILWMEQLPEKLGSTIPEVANELEGLQPMSKSTFSCCMNSGFIEALEMSNRDQILVVGIEAHICVYQTAMDLLSAGVHVEVVTDAVSSRTDVNKQVALDKLATAGAELTSVEMCLFELMQTADHPLFREVSRLIK
ncbi:hydrolase [Endozoicomonas sp. (ex Bugula neritina AB1)]|nr:hydrolase [Endozoicomonas sp. (ex Bugula neritina AB1)]